MMKKLKKQAKWFLGYQKNIKYVKEVAVQKKENPKKENPKKENPKKGNQKKIIYSKTNLKTTHILIC